MTVSRHDRGARFPAFCAYRSEVRSGIAHGSPGTGFTGLIRDRPLRVRPSRTTKSVRPSIRTRVGNKLGTVLATSAPCGHNAKTPRWRRASLGFADFKHHRNLFPIRRRWQTRRTQNSVLARGCGFKSHLRYSIEPSTWLRSLLHDQHAAGRAHGRPAVEDEADRVDHTGQSQEVPRLRRHGCWIITPCRFSAGVSR